MENAGIKSEPSPNDTDLDISWLTVLCLLAYMHENGADLSKIMKLDMPFPSCDFLPSISLACCDDHDYIQNCTSVELEQDMGAYIPFCKLDGEMCNMQCRRCS